LEVFDFALTDRVLRFLRYGEFSPHSTGLLNILLFPRHWRL